MKTVKTDKFLNPHALIGHALDIVVLAFCYTRATASFSEGRYVTTLLCVGGSLVPIVYSFYLLFWQRCLGLGAVARCAAKFYLIPCIPCLVKKRRGDWWCDVDETLMLGALPLDVCGFDHPALLRAAGVVSVLNCCDELPCGYLAQRYAALGMKMQHLAIVDHVEPTLAQLVKGLEFIESSAASKGGKCYVHCRGGHGRSAAFAFCWLVKKHRMGLVDAQQHLNARRRVRKKLYTQEHCTAYARSIGTTQ